MLLHRTFTELQQRSQHLPKHLRLRQDEFVMDPSISEQLQQQLSDKVRERREGEREKGGRERRKGRINKIKSEKNYIIVFHYFSLPVGAGKEEDGLGV